MIRMLADHDADGYVEVRRRALAEAPLAFASSPTDDIAASREAVCSLLRQAPESGVIGAFFDDLVGTVGLYRDRHLKFSHKAHLWGMYVVPRYRGRGVAAELSMLRCVMPIRWLAWRGYTSVSRRRRPSRGASMNGPVFMSGAPSLKRCAMMAKPLSTITWRSI